MKELVEVIVKTLVDHPEEVSVEEVAGEKNTVVELRVNHNDLGKVIGKRGHTARAIRTLLNASAVKNQERVTLEILE